MILSDIELKIACEKEFLLIKNIVIKKVKSLFEELQKELSEEVHLSPFQFPENIDTKIGKIFKGEDYKNLPYVVLDFPKLFNNQDVFVFRTMFWWGNFFSSTFHLQGNLLEKYRQNIFTNLKNYEHNDLYICVNDTPWEYDYNESNYQFLSNENIIMIKNVQFLKLSKKYELNDYNNLKENSKSFLNFIIKMLS